MSTGIERSCRILGWLLFLTPKKMKEFLINPWQPVIYPSQFNTFKVHVGSLFSGHNGGRRTPGKRPALNSRGGRTGNGYFVSIFLVPPKKIEEDTPTEIVIHSDKLLFYLVLGCYNITYGPVIFQLARLDYKKDPEDL